ncbi:hypothetical protein FDN13_06600 [Caloramator sp. E03]|uniref:hypothetical protein n=1 Tax=Caloramator sp. E03 TaxID=2576307 RepID=UPI00111035F7|nr:hypothetical protein [Caloramator sp. E03]QCX33404.1 hypothetical protein FDN13_06600 [Caloramator sp. E03]
MIINTSCKIAVRCSNCGEYNIADVDIFKLKEPTGIKCECGQVPYKVKKINKTLIFDISCIGCENIHSYKFKIRDLMSNQINIISCPNSGIEIAFIGNESYVEGIVEKYRNDMIELLKALGIK